MNVARLDFAPVLQRLLAAVAAHPLLERLFFASFELAVLALLVFGAIRIGRIRSPRLAALLWLLVLGKPLVSLAVGSPFHLFRMEVPAAVAESPATHDAAEPIDRPSSFAKSSSLDVQSPDRVGLDEEMAGAPITPLQHDTTPTLATSPVVSAVATPAPTAHPSHRWNPVTWILGIWLTGVAFFATSSLVDRVRIRRLIRASRQPDPRLADCYLRIAAQMGLKRPAPLRVTDEMEGPGLIGSLVSTILIPDWLAEDADKAKLDWALRHELMHFRLRDPWAGLVRELSQMLFYFHPVAWWAGAKWKTATEKACDRAIVADEAAARDYAEQLYRILVGIHGRRQAALRTGLFATRTQIGQRIAALLYGPRTAPHLSALTIIVVALVTAVTLSVGGAFADKNAKSDEPEKTPAVAAADHPAEPQPAPVSAPTTNKPESTPAPDVTFSYAGTVVDDHGKPVAGAKVSLDYLHASDSLRPFPTLAVTDGKGRFGFSRRKRDFADSGLQGPWWFTAMIAATKPGYGPAGGRSVEFETTGRVVAEQHHPPGWHPKGWSNVLKLASDDVPIHGRVLDTEGRPVSGALVQAINLWEGREGSLDAWEAAARRPGPDLRLLEEELRPINYSNGLTAPRPTLVPAVRSDASGSFTLKGLGRERLADLAVSGPGIETALLHVRTRRGAVIKLPRSERNRKFGEETFYPCDFTRVAGPSVPVEGHVTDARSHRPLAGIGVNAARIPSSPFTDDRAARLITATTDARGHYRLEGLPLGETRLGVLPPLGSPYLMVGVDVKTRMQPSPVVADIKLAAGVMVRGRVTDSRTGMPVEGSLEYFAFWTNPHLEEAPGFEINGFLGGRSILHYRCDADGRFEIPVLPGRGILAYRADALAEFPRGIGAADIDGPKERWGFSTAPTPCRAEMFHLLKPLNPQPGTDSLALDLTVRSPATVTGTVRSPDGKPLVDYSLSDKSSFLEEASRQSRQTVARFEINGAAFEVKVYSPTDHHRLIFYHQSRNLVGYREFTGEPSGPLDITLEPAATLKGRVVDDGGQPLGDVSLVVTARHAVASENRSAEGKEAAAATGPQIDQSQITTDKDGRFELRRVLPGLAYSAIAQGAITSRAGHRVPGGAVFTNILAQAGETKELGDLRITAANNKSAAAPPAKRDDAEVKQVHGRVLLPDGKPAAGARVVALRRYWVENVKRVPLAKATAGADGAFTIAIPQNTPDDGTGTGAGIAWIAAEVDGFGTNYETWNKRDATPKELAIKLLPEVPIHGRILDLEGKPVAGAHVSVNWQQSPRKEFGRWLDSLRAGSLAEFNRLNAGLELQGDEDDSQPPVVTDPAGRFTLRGIGADRVVRLAVHGDVIADTSIDVITRPIKAFPRQTGGEGTAQVFGADFTFQAAPTRLIVGTVRDGATGMPLGGVSIRQLRGSVHTETDSQGKYRLVGLPKLKPGRGWQSRYEISILPSPAQPYLALKELEIPYSPGLGPITLDVKLPRGVWITGRVTDKETGGAAMSAVWYFPALSNPLLKEFPQLEEDRGLPRPSSYTAADGTFRVVGLPGRGLVAVRGIHKIFVGGVEASRFAELAKNYPKGFQRQGFNINAVQEIDPAPGTANVTCDLVVSAGGTMRILLADRDGKPVSPCVFFYDMARGALMNSLADQSPFELTAFEPDESRPIIFHCAKYRIGKAFVIHYDEKSPHSTTVTLEPWATVKGRIVDADGVPKKGEHVEIHARIGKKGFLPAGSSIDCDADGRFVCDNLAPGADSYAISTNGIRDIATFAAVAGKTIDLGDIKPKRKEAKVSTTRPDMVPKPAAALSKPASADVAVTHGRVLVPDSKLAVGATKNSN